MLIYKKEIKRNLKTTVLWSISMAALNFLQMAVYPSIKEETESLKELLTKMPKELVAAFGMDKLSMTEIMGYYGTKSYALLLLIGGMFSIILISAIFAKEQDEKTIEFLLSKPITRNQMITEKLLAGFTHIFLFNIIVSSITYLSFEIYSAGETYDSYVFLLLCSGSLILDIIFGVLGAFLSAFITRGKALNSLSVGITLLLYFLSIVAGTSSKFENLKYLSPFKYVESVDIIIQKQLNGTFMEIAAATVMILVSFTYIVYNRKDIFV